jgi:hypothetical protein
MRTAAELITGDHFAPAYTFRENPNNVWPELESQSKHAMLIIALTPELLIDLSTCWKLLHPDMLPGIRK